jgi:glycerol uptake facilitator protein
MADVTPLMARGEGRRIGRIAGLPGEMMSEFLGTFVLLAFGDGVVAVVVAGLPGSGRTAGLTNIWVGGGNWLLITWGWAMAVAMGVWVAGGVSGAHINPAVTLAFAARRKFPWSKVLPYWFAQLVGAMAGASIVLMLYNSAINQFDLLNRTPRGSGNALATYSIFATFPAGYFRGSIPGPFLDQIVGTAFLLMLVVAVIDARNTAVGSNLAPLVIGLVVAAIGMSIGPNAGYAINPARDFGPRLIAWAAGWGHVALPGSINVPGLTFSNYWWIPIVGPLIGGVIGVLIYDLFISDVLFARLKRAEEVAGPIPETQTMADVEDTEHVEGKVPGTRMPDQSETHARRARELARIWAGSESAAWQRRWSREVRI